MKKAFTLAEVLITLGIIGVVAAMTIPPLVQNHKKSVIETSLKKFYTNINEALKMSELDNGEKTTWSIGNKTLDAYYNQYWANYIDSVETENIEQKKIIYFRDGSAVTIDKWGSSNGTHFYFCPKATNCKKIEDENLGKTIFVFGFWADPDVHFNRFKYHYGKGVVPYMANLSDNYTTTNELYSKSGLGCSTGRGYYCTKLIELNGWKIPKNYPFKF